MTLRFTKGHGTENDFIIVDDHDGAAGLDAAVVRALCDRRAGVGADGVLRVVRAAKDPAAVDQADRAEWFMDYRNADGSLAEMCGNGVRVFAHYLLRHGLVAPGAPLHVATRDGVKTVTTDGAAYTVDMGMPRLTGESRTILGGRAFAGTSADVGNPHLVCRVSDVDILDLTHAPDLDAAHFPHGANVEFVEIGPDADVVAVRMRVYERGAAETRSCGTAACAVARVALGVYGREAGTVEVTVPGGVLRVELTGATSLLTGPAVLVAEGTWLM